MLFEKNDWLGGWIETIHDGNFVNELGPWTIRNNKFSPEVLSVIHDLGILEWIVISDG